MIDENVVANPFVKKQPIPPSDLPREDISRDYKNINFFNLASGLCLDSYGKHHNNSFIHPQKGIMFRDYVGRQLMTANELLYYPELAKKVRENEDLPILKRYYNVDKTINGLEFFDYFNEYVKTCHKDFVTELNNASIQINQLIDDYGQERFMPILNNETYRWSQSLIIHGVEWSVKDQGLPCDPTHNINLYRLFNISKQMIHVSIEEVMPETPFVAVRIIKAWRYKNGHVQWYSLDTRQPVSKREMARWKKSH